MAGIHTTWLAIRLCVAIATLLMSLSAAAQATDNPLQRVDLLNQQVQKDLQEQEASARHSSPARDRQTGTSKRRCRRQSRRAAFFPRQLSRGDCFADLDNDGWVDLFLMNGHVYPQVDGAHLISKYREPKLLFMNLRNGKFRDVSNSAGEALQIPQVSRGVAAGDLFHDGRIDFVVENLEGEPMILRPEGGPHNHWISLELAGTKSNRLALNARVRVTSGDLSQIDEVRSGGSYMSQNDLPLHFGLGSHRQADSVDIHWPSGRDEVLTNLAADRFYCVEEGAGIVACAKIRPSIPPGRRH